VIKTTKDSRKNKEFRDHKVSATKDEIEDLIKKIKKIKILQGSFEKKPTKSEIESGHIKSFRRGVFAKRDIKKGEVLQKEDLITLRPLIGVGAEKFYEIIGKKADRNYEKMESIKT